MSKISYNVIKNKALNLVGKDYVANKCDVMDWYKGFSANINEVACCCAGMMYLFNSVGALDQIPSGKVANCGTLALNFYNAGRLYKPQHLKVGDLVLYSWTGVTTTVYPLNKEYYNSFDHVELCIGINGNSITSIGVNNGGKECDDWQIKSRRFEDVSACCRINYIDNINSILQMQKYINKEYGFNITEDNIFGAQTKCAFIKAIQKEIGKNLKVDGIIGNNTMKNFPNQSYYSYNNKITLILQYILNIKGYSVGELDGIFGVQTEKAVINFQSLNNLVADGIVGKNTLKELFK